MKKRMLSLALALALCLGLTVPALAASDFTDVPSNFWGRAYIEQAAGKGWVKGMGGGKYEPNGKVTYSQFAVMLDKALYSEEFAAQPKGSQWWTPACEVAANHGLFVDTDMADRSSWTTVANRPIEREEMAQMMYNALSDVGAKLPSYEEYSEVSLNIADIIDTDNYDAVATCYAIKLLRGTGNGNFDPHNPMTRAQAAVVLCNIYSYVTGDVTGTAKPDDKTPSTPVVTEKPVGAVGGHYDTSAYDVPADTNKDGWITEAEVQAVLMQLREEYPDGSPWGSSDQWWSPVLGGGSECAGFAYMVSDKIFGNLPAYEVRMEDTRVGDVLKDGPAFHKNVVLNDYGKDVYEGVNYTDSYTTTDGNVSGKVRWDVVNYYEDWPTGTSGTHIYSRYPAE